MVDDVLIDKGAEIERAVRRVREIHGGDEHGLEHSVRQDAIVLNLVRACESSVDAAMHLVRIHRLGVPHETREAFDLLERAGLIDRDVADRLRRMIEFREQALHEGGTLQREVLTRVVADLDVFRAFSSIVLRFGTSADGIRNE